MIKFTHVFAADFKQIYLKGEPYALTRFGDGELGFALRKRRKSYAGEYLYEGGDTFTARKVVQAITANLPGFYIGISCPCCGLKANAWYRTHVKCPEWQLTYANIFVNANYSLFRQLDLKDTVLVSCHNGDFTIPERAINPEWDYKPLLRELFKVDKTILVAAGPMKCGLIYDYWTQAPNRQIILDVGSALDRRIHGKPTRRYHHQGSPTAQRVCRWSNTERQQQ